MDVNMEYWILNVETNIILLMYREAFTFSPCRTLTLEKFIPYIIMSEDHNIMFYFY